jgi:hypothetical protein
LKYDITKLELLFNEAKNSDEFEFCCALLRIQGMADVGWDAFEESYVLINQAMSLINAPMEGAFKMRMLLLLYCHITEMNDFYNITANLLWIKQGQRYRIDPFYFELFEDRKTVYSPERKCVRIGELSEKSNDLYFKDLYSDMVCKQVRNAFFHSNYTLHKDEFRIIKGEGVSIDNTITSVVPWSWLMDRIELTVNFAMHIFTLINNHRISYEDNKIVEGRILGGDAKAEIILLADKNGLYGFKS